MSREALIARRIAKLFARQMASNTKIKRFCVCLARRPAGQATSPGPKR
jgi:hypothetical protein